MRAWQKADEVASLVFNVIGGAKAVPRWLTEQTCKAAVSVPANIAEGYSRGSLGDDLRFLDIARGSLGETEYYVEFLTKNRLIANSASVALSPLLGETGGLLFALIRSLAQKRAAGTWSHHYSVKESREIYSAEADGQGTETEERVPSFEILVSGRPPLYGAAISLNNPSHPSYERAEKLKHEASAKMEGERPLSGPLAMQIENSKREAQGDAANVVQAIFTALEGLVYANDGDIKEVHYREIEEEQDAYVVKVYSRYPT